METVRVIAGEFRSRRLKTLPGLAVRPTPDRLREALFNVLTPRILGAIFVDAYAGSGAVGIEALSRGAARAVFIEKALAAARLIRENLRALGIEDRARVIQESGAKGLANVEGDIYFLDPPYTEPEEYTAALTALASRRSGLVLAQHDKRLELAEVYGDLRRTRMLRQGDNVVSFYAPSFS
jgi:16S rRNA (guanine966-N2)-methyltransferase